MTNQLSSGTVSAGEILSKGGLGAFNVTPPTAMPAGAGQASVVATAATSTTPFGYTEAQANALLALVNEMQGVLVNAGLMKGSA